MTEPNWKERILKQYEELKQKGESFFPYAIFKDMVAIFVVFVAVVILSWVEGAELETRADPTDTTYNPRPEWYFLFLFQALKMFPGYLEAVAAVILPGLALLFLLALPFLDQGPQRHPINRPFFTLLGLVGITGFLILTYQGFKSPLLNPPEIKNPQVMTGQRIYHELRCFYCHSIRGRGGLIGPDLSTVGARRNAEWLKKHFENPQTVSPGSVMPKLNLLSQEMNNLIAYLESLGGGGPYTPRAAKLYEEHCMACHTLDNKGGNDAPDLTTIGEYRDRSYIFNYIRDPHSMNPDTSMPGFEGTLTEEEIEDITFYLLAPPEQRK